MADPQAPRGKGGMIKNILIVVLAPLAVAGVIHLVPAAKGLKAQLRAL